MKIFVLGLTATGKHSLMKALEILGYSGVHYPDSYAELDKFDASCDIFVAKQYKQLDKMYPGSKFIYTVRNEKAWVDDVLAHLQKFRPEQKSESKLQLRRGMWGSVDPSKEQLLAVNRRHEADCRAYFKDRPDDILFMNIPDGEYWEKLCPFLGVDIPSVDFPHVNKYDDPEYGKPER
jgi:hypothetical protein